MKKIILTALSLLIVLSAFIDSNAKNKNINFDVPKLDWKTPDYSEFELDNGISVLVVEDHEVPIVEFFFVFASPYDPEDKVGLNDIATWVLRNGGSTKFSADEMNTLLEFKAAYLNVNAGNEMLTINGSVLKKDLSEVLDLVAGLIDAPLYPEDKLELRRSTMIDGIKRRNDQPRSIAFREFRKLVYPNHPFGYESSVESVNNITRDDLLSYHTDVFKANGTVIGASGAVSADEFKSLLNEKFGHLVKSEKPIVKLPPVSPALEPGVYYVYKDIPQAMIVLGHQTFDYNDPRRHSSIIMNDILGGGDFNSVLMKRIRVDEGLAYSVWSSFSTPYTVTGSFMAAASTRLDQAGRTMTLFNRILNEYKSNGPNATDFERIRKSYVSSQVWDYASSENYLRTLVYYKWLDMPLNTPQIDLDAYLSLSLEDVKNAAGIINPEKFIWVIVGDKEKMDTKLEDFGKVHEINID